MNHRILYVGPRSGTCLQRARALEALGHRVRLVDIDIPAAGWRWQFFRLGNRLRRPPDFAGTNRAILAALDASEFDILWIDRGRSISRRTFERARLKRPQMAQVSYSPDDMMNPDNQSFRYLASVPLYDLHVTTKSYNVAELRALGARDVLFIDNAYDPETHRPVELTAQEQEFYRADVGFVGSFEIDRAEQMRKLASNGIKVSVWGYGWSEFERSHPGVIVRGGVLGGLEYTKAICATRINLCFLRKVNRDLQTTRSVEIPACEAFMLGERTAEHSRLFVEGQEAEFFESFEELLQKCRYYLQHDRERRKIGEAGLRRCVNSRYSNQGRLSEVVLYLERQRMTRERAS